MLLRGLTLLIAVGLNVADAAGSNYGTGVAIDISGEQYASHLFGARAEDTRITPDAPETPERFHMIIAGNAVRADLLSPVGVFPAGTVLLAHADSEDVIMLDPTHHSWCQTTFAAINARQMPSLPRLKNATAKVVAEQPGVSGGTSRRQLVLELDMRLRPPLIAEFIYRVDIWSRIDERLEPARRLLNVLLRRDPLALQVSFPNVTSAFPAAFPVAESVTLTITAAKGNGHVFPYTQPTHRTFIVSDPVGVSMKREDFEVPSSYSRVTWPFQTHR